MATPTVEISKTEQTMADIVQLIQTEHTVCNPLLGMKSWLTNKPDKNLVHLLESKVLSKRAEEYLPRVIDSLSKFHINFLTMVRGILGNRDEDFDSEVETYFTSLDVNYEAQKKILRALLTMERDVQDEGRSSEQRNTSGEEGEDTGREGADDPAEEPRGDEEVRPADEEQPHIENKQPAGIQEDEAEDKRISNQDIDSQQKDQETSPNALTLNDHRRYCRVPETLFHLLILAAVLLQVQCIHALWSFAGTSASSLGWIVCNWVILWDILFVVTMLVEEGNYMID
jgi:hypothetical protein